MRQPPTGPRRGLGAPVDTPADADDTTEAGFVAHGIGQGLGRHRTVDLVALVPEEHVQLWKREIFVVAENGERLLTKAPACDQTGSGCQRGKRRPPHVRGATSLTVLEARPQPITKGIDCRKDGEASGGEGADLGFDLVGLVKQPITLDLHFEASRVREVGDATVGPEPSPRDLAVSTRCSDGR